MTAYDISDKVKKSDRTVRRWIDKVKADPDLCDSLGIDKDAAFAMTDALPESLSTYLLTGKAPEKRSEQPKNGFSEPVSNNFFIDNDQEPVVTSADTFVNVDKMPDICDKNSVTEDVTAKSNLSQIKVSPILIGIVLSPALIWQMEHYAGVVNDLSRIDTNETLSLVFSWMFAFSVTGTAIVMTAAKGNMNYLIGFAIVETLANIIYCHPVSLIEWLTTLLISTAMAFTILSYSEIFAKSFQEK